jgi:hypothetical protein
MKIHYLLFILWVLWVAFWLWGQFTRCNRDNNKRD